MTDDAELVAQVIPSPAVAFVEFNAPLKAIWSVRCDVADVRVEFLQHRFGGDGQLLNRIKILDGFFQVEMLNESLIGFLVNSGLKATQVNRNAVGFFMVQSLDDPLAW
jgi:hypothetical protein